MRRVQVQSDVQALAVELRARVCSVASAAQAKETVEYYFAAFGVPRPGVFERDDGESRVPVTGGAGSSGAALLPTCMPVPRTRRVRLGVLPGSMMARACFF